MVRNGISEVSGEGTGQCVLATVKELYTDVAYAWIG